MNYLKLNDEILILEKDTPIIIEPELPVPSVKLTTVEGLVFAWVSGFSPRKYPFPIIISFL